MSQLELELGLEQGRGRRLHNRSSGCKGSGASGSGITDTSRFFAYSWIHWIRPFLLIKTPTHLPRASHSTIPCKAGTLGFSSRTMKEDISPSLCFPSTVLCNYVQCQFFGSLCASKSSGHFLHWRKKWLRTKSEILRPASFHQTLFDFPYKAEDHLLDWQGSDKKNCLFLSFTISLNWPATIN